MSLNLDKQILFFVGGDAHISEDDNHNNNKASRGVLDSMKKRADYHEHSFFFLLGDLTDSTKERKCYEKIYDDIGNPYLKGKEACMLCDGLGNHDLYSRPGTLNGHKQMYDLIKKRNKERSKIVGKDNFNCDDGMNLHYHIKQTVCGENVHFIYLNLIPVDDKLLKTDDGQNIDGSGALRYLKSRLATIKKEKNEPIFLFHHIGFAKSDEDNDDYWWKEAKNRKNYLDALEGHTIAGMFCGHVHTSGVLKDLKSSIFPSTYRTELTERGLLDVCFLSGAIKNGEYYSISFKKDSGMWVGAAARENNPMPIIFNPRIP